MTILENCWKYFRFFIFLKLVIYIQILHCIFLPSNYLWIDFLYLLLTFSKGSLRLVQILWRYDWNTSDCYFCSRLTHLTTTTHAHKNASLRLTFRLDGRARFHIFIHSLCPEPLPVLCVNKKKSLSGPFHQWNTFRAMNSNNKNNIQ